MVRFALTAVAGGAAGIRADGPADVGGGVGEAGGLGEARLRALPVAPLYRKIEAEFHPRTDTATRFPGENLLKTALGAEVRVMRRMSWVYVMALGAVVAAVQAQPAATGKLDPPVMQGTLFPGTGARYIVFESGVGSGDVCLYDRKTNSRVTLPGLNAPGLNQCPSISSDGRYIAFQSYREGGAGGMHVYLYDRSTSSLVSLPGLNSTCDDECPSISADGRYIAFVSHRAGGVGGWDVYLYDRNVGSLVSLPGLNSTGTDDYPSISADGRYIAFQALREGGVGRWDVYLYDRSVSSLVSLPGLNSSADDRYPSVSSDGRYITFASVRAGGTGGQDLYLYDRNTSSVVALPGLTRLAMTGIPPPGGGLGLSGSQPPAR